MNEITMIRLELMKIKATKATDEWIEIVNSYADV